MKKPVLAVFAAIFAVLLTSCEVVQTNDVTVRNNLEKKIEICLSGSSSPALSNFIPLSPGQSYTYKELESGGYYFVVHEINSVNYIFFDKLSINSDGSITVILHNGEIKISVPKKW
jgi:hypothetical protein